MFRLAWRGVRYNLGRYAATLVAILTGVAFFAGSGFLADGVTAALEGDVDQQYGAVDAAMVVDLDTAPVEGGAAEPTIDAATAKAVGRLPGIEAVAGELTGSVAFLGADGRATAKGAMGRMWIEDGELNPLSIAEGEAPRGDRSIAVSRDLADAERLGVGAEVTVLTPAGPQPATVSGITAFGDQDTLDGDGTVSIPADTAFAWLHDGTEAYSALYVRASGQPDAARDAMAAVAPDGFKAETGADFRAGQRAEVGGFGRALKRALQFFALLALLVGGFVIYNTFSVIVAQRTRELAVLAAVGATPRQLRRSMRTEGLLIGLLGSLLGVAAGYGVAALLVAVLGRVGVELPGGGVRFSLDTAVIAIVFGTLVTALSVGLPARRAARTEPIEALRQSDPTVGTSGRTRTIAALALVGLGVVGMLVGVHAVVIALAGVLLFLGVLLSGRLVAVHGPRLLGPLLRRAGLEGRLAGDNTARNPQRTAATANALLVGVFLVTFVSVAGASIRDYAVEEVNKVSTADFTVMGSGALGDDLLADLRAVDGVETVTPFRRATITGSIDGASASSVNLASGDLTSLVDTAGLTFEEGSADDLRPGSVLLSRIVSPNAHLGSTLTVVDEGGTQAELRVAGIIAPSLDSVALGTVTDAATFDALGTATRTESAFVSLNDGADAEAASDAIGRITELRPDVTLQAGNLVGRLVGSIMNFAINAVNGLLLMSVAVAFIGIVNTMTLSILERRRELGLLRIVGMVDRRVRRMVRIESVVISVLGTATGMAIGVFSGFALVHSIDRLSDADISVSLPPTLLIGIPVLGVLLGLLAAVIPAHRSTRLDVLEAIGAS